MVRRDWGRAGWLGFDGKVLELASSETNMRLSNNKYLVNRSLGVTAGVALELAEELKN